MFVFGKQYALGRCEIRENDFHKNIAYLIVLATRSEITVIGKSDTRHTGSSFLINPLVEHTFLKNSDPVLHIYLAPYATFAKSLDQFTSDSGISRLPPHALPFHSKMSEQEIIDHLEELMMKSNLDIDPRLAAALDDLDTANSLVEIAKRCDLSPSRLRVIAKKQLGVSLETILVWRKLINSIKVLSSGATLSEAAQAGGFSDQAHFTRTMRSMFGITPSDSTQALHY